MPPRTATCSGLSPLLLYVEVAPRSSNSLPGEGGAEGEGGARAGGWGECSVHAVWTQRGCSEGRL